MKTFTYAIIHGSWQCSKDWDLIAQGLANKGHDVKLIDLPGHGKNRHDLFSHITFNTYVNYVCNALDNRKKNQPLILVGHSFSGLVISKVVEYISVDNLVYITAFLPKNNDSLLSLMTMNNIPGLINHIVIDKQSHATYLKKESLSSILFTGCDETITMKKLEMLQPEPIYPPSEKIAINESLLHQIPKDYIECTHDNCISLTMQRNMHERYQCQTHSLPTGHSPFLSTPEKLITILTTKLSILVKEHSLL
ncbi:MAG: alpha/beta fold hydrolase [Gammaproteobacteria bacterium]